jgi:hypothetical protein
MASPNAYLLVGGGFGGFLLGAAIGNLLPLPTDIVYIWLSHWLATNGPNIPSWQYWSIFAVGYYGLPSIWFFFLIVVTLSFDFEIEKRFLVLITLFSIGSVFGLLSILTQGGSLPGVNNLSLGYITAFAILAAITGMGSLAVIALKTEVGD